jgi:hypothetical protein
VLGVEEEFVRNGSYIVRSSFEGRNYQSSALYHENSAGLTIKYGDAEISSPRSATSISAKVSRAAERLAA